MQEPCSIKPGTEERGGDCRSVLGKGRETAGIRLQGSPLWCIIRGRKGNAGKELLVHIGVRRLILAHVRNPGMSNVSSFRN